MDWMDSGSRTAEENMELDRGLLADLGEMEDLFLHLYDWKNPSLTYGHFIDPSKYLNSGIIDMARRPTGGGIVFHLSDLAFSVLVPSSHPSFSENTMENYAFINNKVIEALGGGELLPVEPTALDAAAKNFCMAKPTRYDVILNGKKVGGAAQRRTKAGYLHQGTIFLQEPDMELLQRIVLPGTRVLEGMEQNSHPFAPDVPLEEARRQMKQRLVEAFAE
ncbi:MAG: hypothetical protein K0U13_06825 [Chlamydiae bacterium]|nr:hypothetical protein [Chlamydiota bacterium]